MATGTIKKNPTMLYVGGTTLTNSVPTATVTKLRSATLSKGMWLICAYGYYANDIGNTRASWYILDGGTTISQTDANGQYGGSASLTCLLNVNSSATIYFDAYQTSGSTQSTHANSYLNCIRLY